MKKINRVFVVVMDSLGVGAMPDSPEYGDVGVNTLGHISEAVDAFEIPNLQKLGMANVTPLKQVPPVEKPLGYYGKLNEKSLAKDTMTGHWEMMGLEITTPFKTFDQNGFPQELIQELEKRTGRKVIGNKSSSGTEILEELAEEEVKYGHMIVYTSADSVLQICGNEETTGLEELYRWCEIARELTMKDEWKVGRVIARPYVGLKKGEFRRTSNRHDYALKPYGKTALDALKAVGLDVISVGKIKDIFDGEGITEAHKSKSSVHGMEQTIEIAKKDFRGLCFTNLVDFDALWGHRRDPKGYAEEIEKFDVNLGVLLDTLREDDLLIITADHGNDPTYTGTDHTREKVPFLAYSKSMEGCGELEDTDTFAIVGATVADIFDVEMPEGTIGESILEKLHKGQIMKSIIIGIAGGTGSGKSTFTNRLKDEFKEDVAVIYHDNYYRDQSHLTFEERVKTNYDHPDAIETDLLIEHIRELKEGKAIQCPVYDYSQHNRSDQVTTVEPKKVILLEGILVLADERLRDLIDIKVYVEADADERILRRVIRDVKERGRDIEGVVEQYLTTVKPMHYLYVEPTRSTADIVINSGKNPIAFELVRNSIKKILEEES